MKMKKIISALTAAVMIMIFAACGAGTGIQGVNDYAVEIAAGKTVIVALESGRFKIMSGTNKGKIHLTGAADLKVAAFTLP